MSGQISDAELEIMKVVWRRQGAPVRFAQIMDELMDAGKGCSKNTLITLLSRLASKGFLRADKVGRINEYVPLVSMSDYRERQTRGFVQKYYDGCAGNLVSMLIQADLLTSEEYSELLQLAERKEGQG